MSLIELKDIGKIYVSEGSIAVGIRGVNLSFDRGEFVAVTGRSGSGKSTLLNVISGMDTYEEGELFVDGEPTSHYLQNDWEDYRKEYISFIFQDYNIIESFTVLQNVELALMNIPDPRERRRRALELIDRVGLTDHISHKGSRLSGGQKQRTVIARALAKDSPIILADEPTGNLDSRTSEEIIRLLREVSVDKLVIVVTHNFEQVESCATRHIRIFDGSVEFDHAVTPSVVNDGSSADCATDASANNSSNGATSTVPEVAAGNKGTRAGTLKSGASEFLTNLRNGFHLGRVRFFAMPKLSVFLCVLLLISSLAITLVTSISGDSFGIFDKDYIFTHLDGRVVLIRQDGAPITETELTELKEKLGADSAQRYDFLLDRTATCKLGDEYDTFGFSFGDFDGIDVGRAPEADNEVLIHVPVSYKTVFADGLDGMKLENLFGTVEYDITGISYYYDNTVTPTVVFTESGYNTAAALSYYSSSPYSFSLEITASDNAEPPYEKSASFSGSQIFVSFDLPKESYAFARDDALLESIKQLEATSAADPDYSYSMGISMSGTFNSYYFPGSGYYSKGNDYVIMEPMPSYPSYGEKQQIELDLEGKSYLSQNNVSAILKYAASATGSTVIVSPDIIVDFMYGAYFEQAYTQASLFFGSDSKAHAAENELRELGYVAVPSDSVNLDEGIDALLETLLLIFPFVGWLLSIAFIAIFLGFCTSRAMLATKGDIAIMRSMGIPTPVIRVSVYAQNLIAIIPAFIITAITCAVIFITPVTNSIFMFLQPWQYALIALSIILVSLILSKRHSKKMFSASVKKTLKE